MPAMLSAGWTALIATVVAMVCVLLDRYFRSRSVLKPTGGVFRPASVERAYVEQFVVEDELTKTRRQRDEYFGIIERIEKERNEWINMWREQASQHLTAQSMLERELASSRQVGARAIRMLNEMLKKQKLDPIDRPDKLLPYDGEPVGIAERYALRMKELRDELGRPIVGVEERDLVASTTVPSFVEVDVEEEDAPAED